MAEFKSQQELDVKARLATISQLTSRTHQLALERAKTLKLSSTSRDPPAAAVLLRSPTLLPSKESPTSQSQLMADDILRGLLVARQAGHPDLQHSIQATRLSEPMPIATSFATELERHRQRNSHASRLEKRSTLIEIMEQTLRPSAGAPNASPLVEGIEAIAKQKRANELGTFFADGGSPAITGAAASLEERLKLRPSVVELAERNIMPSIGSVSPALTSSVLQLDRQRKALTLARRLDARPSAFQLYHKHILPAVGLSPALASSALQLEKQRLAADLEHQLARRPSVVELQAKGIVKDASVSGSLISSLVTLERQRQRDGLARRLDRRPSVVELKEKNILPSAAGAPNASPLVAEAIEAIAKQKRADELHDFLMERRPSMAELKDAGILPLVADELSASLTCTALSLESRLKKRPSIDMLQEKNILKSHTLHNPITFEAKRRLESRVRRNSLSEAIDSRPGALELMLRGILLPPGLEAGYNRDFDHDDEGEDYDDEDDEEGEEDDVDEGEVVDVAAAATLSSLTSKPPDYEYVDGLTASEDDDDGIEYLIEAAPAQPAVAVYGSVFAPAASAAPHSPPRATIPVSSTAAGSAMQRSPVSPARYDYEEEATEAAEKLPLSPGRYDYEEDVEDAHPLSRLSATLSGSNPRRVGKLMTATAKKQARAELARALAGFGH